MSRRKNVEGKYGDELEEENIRPDAEETATKRSYEGKSGDRPPEDTVEAEDVTVSVKEDARRAQMLVEKLASATANALTPSSEMHEAREASPKRTRRALREPLANLLSPLFSKDPGFGVEDGDDVGGSGGAQKEAGEEDGHGAPASDDDATDRWVSATAAKGEQAGDVKQAGGVELVDSPSHGNGAPEEAKADRKPRRAKPVRETGTGKVSNFLKMLEETDAKAERELSTTMSRLSSPSGAQDESSSFLSNSHVALSEQAVRAQNVAARGDQPAQDDWERQSSISAYAPSLSGISTAQSSVYGSVRGRMTSITMELEDKTRTLTAMKQKLRQERSRVRDLEEHMAKQEARKIKGVREEYEDTIQRHLSFIDRLLADKQTLSEKCDALASELKRVENMYSGGVGELKERHAAEMKKQKDAWLAQEKVRREKWMEDKTREIKTTTIKGLEPEVQRILSKHKRELRRIDERKQDELRQAKEELVARHEESLRVVRERYEEEKEHALSTEHGNWRDKLNDVTDECEARVNEIRDRLEDRVERQRNRFEKERADMIKRHAMQVDKVQRQEVKKREELEARHTSLLEDLQAKQDARMTVESARFVEQRNEWQRLLEEKLRQEAVKKEQKLRDRLREERDAQIDEIIERLDEENNKQLSDLTAEYESRIRDMERQHNVALGDQDKSAADARKRADRLSSQLEASKDRCDSLEARLDEAQDEISVFKDKLGRLTRVADDKEINLRREYAEKRSGDLKAIDGLKVQVARLQNQVASFEEEREEIVEAERRKKEDEIDTLQARVEQTISRKDSLIKMLQEQVEDLSVRAKTAEMLLERQRTELLS